MRVSSSAKRQRLHHLRQRRNVVNLRRSVSPTRIREGSPVPHFATLGIEISAILAHGRLEPSALDWNLACKITRRDDLRVCSVRTRGQRAKTTSC